MKQGERVAAVEKIEDQRKPDDFFGHRKRNVVTGVAFPQKMQALLDKMQNALYCFQIGNVL